MLVNPVRTFPNFSRKLFLALSVIVAGFASHSTFAQNDLALLESSGPAAAGASAAAASGVAAAPLA